MKLDKDIIKRFKDLGFTDIDIAELDRLSTEYEKNDLYRKIGKLNNEVLDIDIRPVNIDISNIESRLKHDKSATPSSIIKEYQREERVAYGGTTSYAENYYNDLALEMSRYGVTATPEQLYQIYNTSDFDTERIEHILTWFRQYIRLVEDGVELYVVNAIDLAEELQHIIDNYSGVDFETGEILDDNNNE